MAGVCPRRRRSLRVTGWVLLAALLAWPGRPAAEPGSLDAAIPGRGQSPVAVRMDVLEDPSGALTVDDIRRQAERAGFAPTGRDVANFGFSRSAFWFRLVVAERAAPLILEIANPMLHDVEVHRVNADGSVSSRRTGSTLPVETRELEAPTFAFHVPAGPESTIYVRVAGQAALRVPIRLWREPDFDSAERHRALANGFFYGGVALVALFQLVLTVVTRYRGHLSFVVALVAGSVLLLNLDGYGACFLWPDLAPYVVRLNAFTAALTLVALLGFTSSVLSLRQRHPRWLAAHVVAAVACVVASLAFWNTSVELATFAASFLLMLAAGLVSWYEGFRPARVFVVAWSVLLAGVFLGMSLSVGVDSPFGLSADLFYKFAAMPAIAMFSASLTERVSTMRQSAELARQALREYDETLVEVAQGVVGASGNEVFDSLVQHMTRALEADIAFVGELVEPERARVVTVAAWKDGGPADNFDYDLDGTPCQNVIARGICAYPEGVARTFPQDTMLATMGIEGYVGTPLFDSSQQAIGLLACLYTRPVAKHERVRQTLQIFAGRAAAELERRRRERVLREQEALLRSIVDYSPAVTYVKDTEGRYLLVNNRFELKAGRKRDGILGRTDPELFGADAGRLFQEHDRAALASPEPLQFEERDGSLSYLSTKVALRDADGHPWALVGVSTEITDFERVQAQARAAQRMEAFGQLAGGIAHDFNNLLTAIIGYIDLCESDAEPGSAIAADLREAKDASLRAARITDQLLAFARRQRSSPQVVDLNAVLTDIERLLQQAAGPGVSVRFDLTPSAVPVRVDVGQFEQVVLNLVLNARDAMPAGGTVTLATRLDRPLTAAAPDGGPDHGRVKLEVRDTGEGIDAEHLPRIFEPFFTTKGAGRGTGLGLAMSHGIVMQAGGTIDVTSRPGVGSTFTVVLPASPLDPDRVTADAPVSAAGGRETVLVVDDEAAVRTFVARVLASKGYQVLIADGGPSGVELASKHAGRIDLLLTDVAMPELTGRDVAERVRAMRPGVAVMYMSGYAERALAQDGLVKDGSAFLPKPFTMAQLASAVRHTLDRHAAVHPQT